MQDATKFSTTTETKVLDEIRLVDSARTQPCLIPRVSGSVFIIHIWNMIQDFSYIFHSRAQTLKYIQNILLSYLYLF